MTSPNAETDATADLDRLLDRLDELVDLVDALAGTPGDTARSLAEALYLVHRSAVRHLNDALGDAEVQRLSAEHPAIAWLFEVYLQDPDDGGAATPPPGSRTLPIVSTGSPR